MRSPTPGSEPAATTIHAWTHDECVVEVVPDSIKYSTIQKHGRPSRSRHAVVVKSRRRTEAPEGLQGARGLCCPSVGPRPTVTCAG